MRLVVVSSVLLLTLVLFTSVAEAQPADSDPCWSSWNSDGLPTNVSKRTCPKDDNGDGNVLWYFNFRNNDPEAVHFSFGVGPQSAGIEGMSWEARVSIAGYGDDYYWDLVASWSIMTGWDRARWGSDSGDYDACTNLDNDGYITTCSGSSTNPDDTPEDDPEDTPDEEKTEAAGCAIDANSCFSFEWLILLLVIPVATYVKRKK